jgi:hypothetical protein
VSSKGLRKERTPKLCFKGLAGIYYIVKNYRETYEDREHVKYERWQIFQECAFVVECTIHRRCWETESEEVWKLYLKHVGLLY